MAKKLPTFYNCLNCTAYCCTYGHIPVNKKDVRRLAKHFGVSEKKAEKRYTKKDGSGGRVLRHRFDAIFESACTFLDQDSRTCTIHVSRPSICRQYPGSPRCQYYDFLQAERNRLEDPDLAVAAYPVDL